MPLKAARRDFTYIDDVVDGIVGALAFGAADDVFNLGNHRTVSLLHFIDVIERALGVRANRTLTPMAAGDVLATFADIRHARARLGYSPTTTIEVGMRSFIEWYRSPHFRPEFAEDGEWRRKRPPANGTRVR